MKISLHYTLQSDGNWQSTYGDFLDEVKRADGLGLYGVYVGEHHFAKDGWCPAPFLPLSAAASVTRKVMLGTDIIVLPLHNPFSIAEQTAVLDVLSSGRAILGVGLGYRPEEYTAFEKDLTKSGRLLDSNLEKVRSLLEGKEVPADRYVLKIYPTPVQRPRPQIKVGAKSEAAVRRAAHRGDAWIMDPVTGLSLLQSRLAAFQEELSKLGKAPVEIPLRREYYVSKDRSENDRVLQLMLESYRQDYYMWGHLQDEKGRPVDPKVTPYEDIKDFVASNMLVGEPSQLIEKIELYKRKLGITELLVKMSFPGISHEMRMRAIELTAREIIPHC
ncbi:MAG: LLM class flavin-dependent oxidoreductase [Nitrososphaerota archaeon]|nr:LLM class flavin-dependent oxidoreductase [Nitrososphaerota archaeon]